MKRLRRFLSNLNKVVNLPIVTALACVVAFCITFLTDAPIFQQPKYKFVTMDTFMNYIKEDNIYYLPGIYECITNQSNDWSHSLIEVVEIKLNSGVAVNTSVYLDIYDGAGYTENGLCILNTIVPDIPTSSDKIDLKSFDEGRTLYLPLSITSPVYDSQDGKKVYSSEELNSMERILIQYRPQYIEYQNGKWQRVPFFGSKKYRVAFDGMKISRPINIGSESQETAP